jgi:hypothetical protein
VPEYIARHPEQITVELIEAEDNAEVRRVMIERYGISRYMQDCGAVKLHKDECGELFKKNMGQHEEPLVFVKVKNSTPEPDGSIKDYFLRVPPITKKARDGIAWTFGSARDATGGQWPAQRSARAGRKLRFRQATSGASACADRVSPT